MIASSDLWFEFSSDRQPPQPQQQAIAGERKRGGRKVEGRRNWNLDPLGKGQRASFFLLRPPLLESSRSSPFLKEGRIFLGGLEQKLVRRVHWEGVHWEGVILMDFADPFLPAGRPCGFKKDESFRFPSL